MSVGMSPLRLMIARQRLRAQARRGAPPAALGVAHQPPVALGAQRAGAGHDRVDVLAQAVEQLAVGVVAQPARAAAERGVAVGAGHEVDDRVRPVGGSPRAQVQPREQLAARGPRAGLGGRSRRQGRDRVGGRGARGHGVINTPPERTALARGRDEHARLHLPRPDPAPRRPAGRRWPGRSPTATGLIGDVVTVSLGREHSVRDITIEVRDTGQAGAHRRADRRAAPASACSGTRTGRCSATPAASCGSTRAGRSAPCRRCATCTRPGWRGCAPRSPPQPALAARYTMISRSVAICTNGTRVLGLGNIGPVASMPVMEGKAVFYDQFAGISAMPILIDATDVDTFVETVVRIAPTFGGIHLEDISAPECFEIERRLIERLPQPVMHDDVHGTAVVSLAAAMVACRYAGIELAGRDRRSARARRRRVRDRVADGRRRRAAGDRVRPARGVARAGPRARNRDRDDGAGAWPRPTWWWPRPAGRA